jgi:hypothetical protein
LHVGGAFRINGITVALFSIAPNLIPQSFGIVEVVIELGKILALNKCKAVD